MTEVADEEEEYDFPNVDGYIVVHHDCLYFSVESMEFDLPGTCHVVCRQCEL